MCDGSAFVNGVLSVRILLKLLSRHIQSESLKSSLASEHPAVPPTSALSPELSIAHQRGLLLRHCSTVRQNLCRVLLKLSICECSLASSLAALPDTAERRHDDKYERGTTNRCTNSDLGSAGEAVPFLLQSLGGRGVVVAVEFQWSGVAKAWC